MSACKKNSNDVIDDKATIVGKWYQKKSVASAYENGVKKGADDVDSDFTVKDYIEFKSNGKAVSGSSNGIESSYTVTGNKVKITYSNPSDNQEFTINKLTSTDLVLYWEYDIQMKNGVVVYKEATELTFKK